jgi:hypothetical protein
MKALSISLGAMCVLLAGCGGDSDKQAAEGMVRAALVGQGNVQQLDLSKQSDNNYAGIATLRMPDGQTVRLNCTARRTGSDANANFTADCGQVIDQALIEQLKANMRRSLEQQSLTVADIQLTKQDEDHVTGFAQVSDTNTGESARLVCTGARQTGGRILARCDVPGGPAQDAAPAPAEEPSEGPEL